VFRFLSWLWRRSGRPSYLGRCEECARTFHYTLVHNGFAETAYAYCDTCGTLALLSGWYEKIPAGAPLRPRGPIGRETEPWLQPCSCGGRFRREASPRCPHCMSPLSADAAARYIERNAPGARRGWRWQRSWLGDYCIVIEQRIVNNNWRESR
jgi:hypothetical protein